MKAKTSILQFSTKVSRVLWYLMIAILPITSMPIIARVLGSDTVAAPAIVVVFFLMLFWFLPHILKGGRLVKESIPLFLFTLIAIAATILSNFRIIPPYKEIDYLRNSLESVITLLIGVSFFLVSSSYLTNEEDAKLTLRVLNWSGLVMLIWSGFQVVAWYGFGHYPAWMFDLQGMISSRVLYRQRVNGLALEPSWFAHQLNMVYLPIWLAASIKGFTAHKKRLGFLSFENILLVGGVGALILTLSRVGLMGFLLMFTYLLIKLHTLLVDKVMDLLFTKRNKTITQKQKRGFTVLISVVFIIGYVVLLGIGLWVFSKVDPRMESLFDFSVGTDNPLLSYFNELSFGERVIYWLAGWTVFTQYPILGVGLGNAGYYFPTAITPYGWNLIEVRRLAYRSSILLNVKSLWTRLLAETGLVGFSFFFGWLYSLIVKYIKRSEMKHTIQGVFSLAGIFILCSSIAEGFSIDSFAMPYLWIGLGLAAVDLNPS